MKVAVSSTGKNLESPMDLRFGRAAWFLIVDPETLEFEALENVQNLNLPQGAGIQAAKTVLDRQAGVLITGNCGPKAFRVLSSAGIKVFTGASGSVRDVVELFKGGSLREASEANVDGHWI